MNVLSSWWAVPRSRVVVGVVVLLMVAGAAAALLLRGGQAVAPRTYSLISPRIDTLTATVSAAGQIEPERTINLQIGGASRIIELMVDIGERVRAGQPLARGDDRDLQLRLAQAQAALSQAQANEEKLRGGATRSDIAQAQAQLQQAQGQLLQVQGGVTDADLAAAQAQLLQAQAALARLTGGPKQSDIDAAQARIRDAELTLLAQRDQLSATKTNAQIALQQATNTLTQSQSRYSTAKQNWEYVQATGADPIVREVADSTRPGQTKANTLNDSQRQQYYDAFVQAEAALRTAENNVRQAQVSYENALSAERTGVERAEGQLAVSVAQLDQLGAAPEADQIAAARAQVSAARANLTKLGGDQRTGALQAAQAAVSLAEARLAQLEDGPQSADIAAAVAQVESARAQVGLAELALAEATLVAPFDGEVAEINLKVGEVPTPGRPAIVLTDLSRMHVNVTVDEVDISRIVAGQPVTLTLDALPSTTLTGRVETIAPLAVTQSAVTSYRVRIGINAGDQRVRPGMSTNADIIVDRRADVLILPRRAVRNDRGQLVIDLVRDQGLCAVPREQWPERPELDQRNVEVGVSNEQDIEVIAGAGLQDCVFVEGVEVRFRPFSGPPPRGGG
jgi:HlyD family secretion protein